jgi:hypothetical protein
MYNINNLNSNHIKKHHDKIENHIENEHNFTKIWNEKCKKYNNTQPFILPPVNRIIVIGDLHGDWETTIKSLKLGKLIDDNNNWIGGDTVVVQVGDQIDRCRLNGIPCENINATLDDEASDIKILEFFTNLHMQAQKYGGAVYSLLGNHEIMNVEQDFRYVSYKGFKQFENYKIDNNIVKDGKTVRSYLFKPGNKISEFLACTRQVALIIGSNIFIHAGILPIIAEKYSVKSINQIMTLYLLDRIKDSDENYNTIFNGNDYSPLWNRIYGNLVINKNNNLNTCNNLIAPLQFIYNIDKIYIGHTPNMQNGISSICNDKIWLTDYGASKAFNQFHLKNKKYIQVLEILNDGENFNILKEKISSKVHYKSKIKIKSLYNYSNFIFEKK